MLRVALIGDFDAEVPAHKAIPLALERARSEAGLDLTWTWTHTATLGPNAGNDLASYDALWCVPASPYANTAGALSAIRFARESGRPFLGTCGGFQHALLEYAEAAWSVASPAHAEVSPDAEDPVIAPLACSLVEESGDLWFTPGSRLAEIYGAAQARETYRCRYGLSPRFAARLESGPMRASARDEAQDVRAVELTTHPFFIATLYQPERAALAGESHPLIAAFVQATADTAARRRIAR